MAGFCACALLLAAIATQAHGQPFGYIVNAGDPTDDGSHDNLWRVNLGNGEVERIGPLGLTIPNTSVVQSDVEGLALETSSFLYGVNDATNSLVYVSTTTGAAVTPSRNVDNLRLGLDGVELDPGLTFDCSGNLLMSSANRRTLYRIDKLSGEATAVGGEGQLGVRIGDIAAYRDIIYGIGINGDEGLYRIDPEHGTASLIGRFGIDVSLANAGLDTSSTGALWAVGTILANGQPQPSQILRIDTETGAATLGATTIVGVKSLALAPTNCSTSPPPPPRGTDDAAAVPVNSPYALMMLILTVLALAWHRHRSG